MAAIVKNLSIEKGAAYRLRFIPQVTGGTPLDLTGCTAKMQVRDAADTLIDELSTANGRIALGGVAGTVDLWFPAGLTAAQQKDSGVYDLEITPPSGPTETWKLARGRVKYLAEVTREARP
jgi:hypothetical protein